MWTHRTRRRRPDGRKDALRALDPLLRRMIATRPWRGVEDRELDARVDELPHSHAPAREPVAGAPSGPVMMTASKR